MSHKTKLQALGLTSHSLDATIEILTETEARHNSVRNSFFHFFQRKKQKFTRQEYNAIYHLCLNIIRRKNLLDKYLDHFVLDTVDKDAKLYKWTALLIIFLLKEETYSDPQIDPQVIPVQLLAIITRTIAYRSSQQGASNINQLFEQAPKITLEMVLGDLPEVKQLALRYYHPYWITEYYIRVLGKENAIKLMNANNMPRMERTIRLNYFKPQESEITTIMQELQKENIETQRDSDFPELLTVTKGMKNLVLSRTFKRKRIVIQSKVSASIAYLLSPQDGEFIVDLAAAPGMKATHLLTLFQGEFIAIEYNRQRCKALKQTLMNTNTGSKFTLINGDSRFLPFHTNSVDKILLDAPCSSTGIFDMYPDHKWFEEERVDQYAKKQNELLCEGLRILRKGGIGIYSVCSVHHKEGESIIRQVLPQIEILPLSYGIPAYAATDTGEAFPPEISLCRRTFPHLHGTSSFFICKFKKR